MLGCLWRGGASRLAAGVFRVGSPGGPMFGVVVRAWRWQVGADAELSAGSSPVASAVANGGYLSGISRD